MALPRLFLYTRPGCHLCDDARSILQGLLVERARAGRPAPLIEERDIERNPTWQREFFTTIPVIELGARRLKLATSAGRIRRLLAEELDGATSSAATD